jgi:hypothetical protein
LALSFNSYAQEKLFIDDCEYKANSLSKEDPSRFDLRVKKEGYAGKICVAEVECKKPTPTFPPSNWEQFYTTQVACLANDNGECEQTAEDCLQDERLEKINHDSSGEKLKDYFNGDSKESKGAGLE